MPLLLLRLPLVQLGWHPLTAQRRGGWGISVDFAAPKIPPINANIPGITSCSLSDPETEDRRLFERSLFLRALEAQSEVGLMRSNCLRND